MVFMVLHWAHAMLRRQQANAVIAARAKIVEGAVGMVEMALAELSAKSVVELDDERRAAMVSNLMVVLCSEEGAHPLSAEIFDAVSRWADDDLRSTNAQIEFLLREALRKAGRLPRPKDPKDS